MGDVRKTMTSPDQKENVKNSQNCGFWAQKRFWKLLVLKNTYFWSKFGIRVSIQNCSSTPSYILKVLLHFWKSQKHAFYGQKTKNKHFSRPNSKDVWPPSSPDLNLLDFFVWGAAERDTNRSLHNAKESLITSIMEVFANFPREAVVTTCSRVRSRLEEVVDPKGDFIP